MVTPVDTFPTVLASSKAVMSPSSSGGTNVSLYATGDTNVKPPDYHLPFTGDQVVDALWKIINLDLQGVGGIIRIESSEDAPVNLDTITNRGNYVTDYITGATVPDEFRGMKPININVSVKTNPDGSNTIIQVIESGGAKYYRWTKDGGITWSPFALKSTNDPIDTSGNATDPPPKDPVTEIKDRLTNTETDITKLKNAVANSLRLGTAEIGTQILNGTFDYDTTFPAITI